MQQDLHVQSGDDAEVLAAAVSGTRRECAAMVRWLRAARRCGAYMLVSSTGEGGPMAGSIVKYQWRIRA